MSEPLIINFTPTGMVPTKKMTPHVPLSVKEIVEDVQEAWECGITMLHLHARDPLTGEPTNKAEVYGELIQGVRKFAPELVICVSLSGRMVNEFEYRAQPLGLEGDLKPDMGSLTLSSLNFNKQASINQPQTINDLALRMKERGILPELEAFDSGMINYANYLIKKGLISPPYYFNLIFGNIACAQPDLLHAGIMLRDLPENSLWSFGGVGDCQFMMNSIAIAINGGVRVGLEDNIYFDRQRTRLAKNIDLIKRVHVVAEAGGRPVMSSRDLRKRLCLKEGFGAYGRA
jgi:3-keto-5-aminohexanoate cleavage enzyme